MNKFRKLAIGLVSVAAAAFWALTAVAAAKDHHIQQTCRSDLV